MKNELTTRFKDYCGEAERLSRSMAIIWKMSSTITEDDDFEHVACEVCSITLPQLRSKSRKEAIIIARAICYYYVRRTRKWTLQAIGDKYGGTHHTTVLNAINKVNFKHNYVEKLEEFKMKTMWHDDD